MLMKPICLSRFAGLVRALAALACLFGAHSAHALNYVKGCALANGTIATNFAAPSPSMPTLTIGRDVPNGTVVYRHTVTGPPATIECNLSFTKTSYNPNWITSNHGKSSWNQGIYGGKTWETGVPGIGVAVQLPDSQVVLPHRFEIDCDSSTCTHQSPSTKFELVLIKTGPVTPGWIKGSDLPTVGSNWWRDRFSMLPDDSGVSATRVTFAGSGIHVLARTCRTPDVNVDMGNALTNRFRGKGSGSPWRTFSVRLEECPSFYRSQTIATSNFASPSVAPVTSVVGTTPNRLGVVLTPTTAILDRAAGVVALSPGTKDQPAATGVGLQLSTTGEGAGTPVQFDKVMPTGIEPEPINDATYRFELHARYYQTGDAVTPGQANSAVMFTIDYQ